jgi:pyruvate dehydrogenase E2 component (dihydrolipoamide acetyltransferase)
MRAAIGRRMTESKQQAPHFYVETEVAMDRVNAAVAELAASSGASRVTVTAFLVRGVALALRAHPQLNACWSSRGLERVAEVNVAVAVALEDGLIAPALLGADLLSLTETVAALGDLVSRARSGKLRALELSEGTFTLSNLGMFDVTRFTAIVVPPQVAILATGRTVERPTAINGEIVLRPVMAATASADHRALDGADVAAFLTTFKCLLESPESL